jgi:hypothetical protein
MQLYNHVMPRTTKFASNTNKQSKSLLSPDIEAYQTLTNDILIQMQFILQAPLRTCFESTFRCSLYACCCIDRSLLLHACLTFTFDLLVNHVATQRPRILIPMM